jgi:ribose transport system substrate-binding protein
MAHRLVCVLLPLFLLSGCDTRTTETAARPAGVRVALLMKSRQNPFFDRMAAGAEKAAKENGVELSVLAIDKETDAEKQAAQVEVVTGQGVQAILIAPADSKAIVAPLLQAQARGIHIINLDNRIDADAARSAGLKVATFVGPDNQAGARKSTQALIEKVDANANPVSSASRQVAMLEGIRGVSNAEARKRGFQEAIDSTKGRFHVVAMDSAEWMTEPAQKKMEAILNAHPNLMGVFCANDMMALGAIQAIASAGRTGRIVVTAYDNIDAARQAIRAGTLHATVEQHPDRMGELGVQAAVRIIRGESVPPEMPVETDLITAATLQTSTNPRP